MYLCLLTASTIIIIGWCFNNLLTNGKPGLWTWTNFTPQTYIKFLFRLLWYKFLYLFIWGLDSERQLRLCLLLNLSPMLLTVNSVILPIGFTSTQVMFLTSLPSNSSTNSSPSSGLNALTTPPFWDCWASICCWISTQYNANTGQWLCMVPS